VESESGSGAQPTTLGKAVRVVLGCIVVPVVALILLLILVPDPEPESGSAQTDVPLATSTVSPIAATASNTAGEAGAPVRETATAERQVVQTPPLPATLTTSQTTMLASPGWNTPPTTASNVATRSGWGRSLIRETGSVALNPGGLPARLAEKFPRGRLYFCAEETGARQVYVASIDGQEVRQLTSEPSGVKTFRLSTAARQIAWLSVETPGRLRFLHLDTGTLHEWPDDKGGRSHDITSFAWHPDGSRLIYTVFERGRQPLTRFFARSLSATAATFLASVASADCRVEDVVPGSGDIIFIKRVDMADAEDWELVRLSAQSQEQISYEEYGLSPRVSPAGTEIVFARFAGADDPEAHLVVMDLEGVKARVVARAPAGSRYLEPEWVPDAGGFFFVNETETGRRIWSCLSHGAEAQRLFQRQQDESLPQFLSE